MMAISPAVTTTSTQAQSTPVAVPSQPTARAQLVRTLIAHPDTGVYDFALSLDAQTIVSTSRDRSVRVFKWRDNVQDLRIDAEVSNTWFSGVSISPDGQTLVTRRTDGVIQLRDLGSGQVRTTLSPSGGSGIAAIAANNRTLVDAAGTGGDFRIRLWNLNNQQSRSIGGNWANLTAITPDCYILVAASQTGTATAWNLIRGQRLSTFPTGATEGATAIAISADGLRVFVAKTGRAEEWNARTGTLTRSGTDQLRWPLLQTNATITALAVSPNGQTLAIGFGNYIQMRDLRSNRPLYNLSSNATSGQVMRFSPDGRVFFNSDGGGQSTVNDRLRVWQLP